MNYIQIVGKYINLVAEATIQLPHLINVRISYIFISLLFRSLLFIQPCLSEEV